MRNTAIKAIVVTAGVGAALLFLALPGTKRRSGVPAGAAIDVTAADPDPTASNRGARRQPPPRFAVATAPDAAPAEVGADRDPSDCERTCGAACVRGVGGELQCPKLCKSDNECESGALCLPIREKGKTGTIRRCIVSDCSGSGANNECPPGMACQYTGRLEGGVYRCQPVGNRSLGQTCSGKQTAGLCGPGMRCVLGTCQPESCQSDADCSKGYRCRPLAGGDGHSKCFPGCERDDDCPSGQTCVQAGETSFCTAVRDTCLQTGCPAGLVCHIDHMSSVNLRAACRTPCDPENPGGACGSEPGQVCSPTDFWNQKRNLAAVCWKTCALSDPSSCPKNYECRAVERDARCFARPSGATEPGGSSAPSPT